MPGVSRMRRTTAGARCCSNRDRTHASRWRIAAKEITVATTKTTVSMMTESRGPTRPCVEMETSADTPDKLRSARTVRTAPALGASAPPATTANAVLSVRFMASVLFARHSDVQPMAESDASIVAGTVLVGARILLARTHTVNQPKVSPMRFQKRALRGESPALTGLFLFGAGGKVGCFSLGSEVPWRHHQRMSLRRFSH